jgi:hypothetical protein
MVGWLIYGVIGVIGAVGGCFLTAWGIAMLSHWMASPSEVLDKPVFWVLLVLLAWFCLALAASLVLAKKKTFFWRLVHGFTGLIATAGVCYFTAWGIFRVVFWEVHPEMVFTRPLFWGLLIIFGGIYFFFPALSSLAKNKKIASFLNSAA